MLKLFEQLDLNNLNKTLDKARRRRITKEVKCFKKHAIKKFIKNIKEGRNGVTIKFSDVCSYDFLDEVSEIVIKELREDKRYSSMRFDLVWTGFMSGYKALKIELKEE